MTKILYDLHIHSALSPCADNDMTPVNIGAMSSAKGLQIIAVADHNAIANVAAAREVGEALDVIVVPAVELQTQEDVHILCLFETFENLQSFFDERKFSANNLSCQATTRSSAGKKDCCLQARICPSPM